MKVGGFDNEQKKKKKKKRLRKPKANRKQMLENSLKSMLPDSKLIWKDDGDKLSEAIVELAQPLLEKCSNFEEQKKLLSFSILVWNMCNVPEKEADKFRKDLYEKICKGDKQAIRDMDEIMGYLIARKNRFYKNDKRFIVSYNITKTKDGLHLDVAYPQAPIEQNR